MRIKPVKIKTLALSSPDSNILPDHVVRSGIPSLYSPLRMPVLQAALLELLAASLRNRIDPIRSAQADLTVEFEAIGKAARTFQLDDGQALADIFWTAPSAIWNGTVARTLRQRQVSSKGRHNVGYLALFCQDASPRILFWSNASPLRLHEPITGTFVAGGPYLVLVQCSLGLRGELTTQGGFAQSVFKHDCFLPVSAGAERDLLGILLALQDRLDNHGWVLTIGRRILDAGIARCFDIEIDAPDGRHAQFRAEWCETSRLPDAPDSLKIDKDTILPFGASDLASGRLVNHLIALIKGAARNSAEAGIRLEQW
jgi:hypothetical protein